MTFGGEIASYQPGQYITLRVKPEAEEFYHNRHYSLSAAPGHPYYRITVKREDAVDGKPAGVVSTWLHNHAEVGTALEVTAPAGSFTLDMDSEQPLVLISGGVGLTPMVSMLESVLIHQPNRKVTFIHAARCGSQHAMKHDIVELASKHPQLNSYVIYEIPGEGDQCHKTGYVFSPLSLEDVAETSGFANYTYFHRVFRSRFGVSPLPCIDVTVS